MPDKSPIRVFDGHNDALLEQLIPHDSIERSFFSLNEGTHIDLPRMKKGGVSGGIFAMFVPPEGRRNKPDKDDLILTAEGYRVKPQPAVSQPYADQITREMISLARRLVDASGGELAMATSIEDILSASESDSIALVLHMEGAEAITPDLNNLSGYYDLGLRSLGPVWSRENAFGHGVPFQYPSSPDTGPGLTPAGKELIAACNKLGILIDLAHLNEKGFWQAAGITDKPIVVSHSAANALTRTSRNLTDQQLGAIGESGGLIGLNFCVSDLHPTGDNDKSTPLARLVEHFRYIADRIGVDHVAFGSDFDGATVSDEIGDITAFPRILAALRSAGFDQSDIQKIASRNWLRVLEQTWE